MIFPFFPSFKKEYNKKHFDGEEVTNLFPKNDFIVAGSLLVNSAKSKSIVFASSNTREGIVECGFGVLKYVYDMVIAIYSNNLLTDFYNKDKHILENYFSNYVYFEIRDAIDISIKVVLRAPQKESEAITPAIKDIASSGEQDASKIEELLCTD